MRQSFIAAVATLALLGASAFVTGPATAAPVPSPAGIAAAVGGANMLQEAAYVCRRVRYCGPYGCVWRRHCWWTGPHPYYWGHHRHWWGGRWHYY